MVLYMAVTPDELELPMVVADSCAELAGIFNVKTHVVYSAISHRQSGKNSGRKFVRVEVNDND